MTVTNIDAELTRHLDRITKENGAVFAVLFTVDGLVKSACTGLDRAVAERTAASLAGLLSLSPGLLEFCDTSSGTWRRSLVEFSGHTVLILTAGNNTCLGVSVAAGLGTDTMTVVARTALNVTRAMSEHLGADGR